MVQYGHYKILIALVLTGNSKQTVLIKKKINRKIETWKVKAPTRKLEKNTSLSDYPSDA